MEEREHEYLEQRAKDFLNTAKEKWEAGLYHLAAFCVEQYLQLYLKAVLCELAGDYPKTHGLRRLLRGLAEVTGKKADIEAFIAKHAVLLGDIEDAYITARYIPRDFEREEVVAMVHFAEALTTEVKRWRSQP